MKDKKALTAPCGLDCFNCEIYEENITPQFVQYFQEKMGVAPEDVPCRGCRQQDGQHFHLPKEGCATLDCAKAKGVEFCSDCQEFPCALLAPLADGAGTYPHNFKLYNLCRIKLIGFEQWSEHEAKQIRQKYFKAPFVVGLGQADS